MSIWARCKAGLAAMRRCVSVMTVNRPVQKPNPRFGRWFVAIAFVDLVDIAQMLGLVIQGVDIFNSTAQVRVVVAGYS